MASNTLTNIMPQILARGLAVLRERCVMPRMVSSAYEEAGGEKGSVIEVPVPVEMATRDVAPSHNPVEPVAYNPGKVNVTLDNWRSNDPFHLTDKELVQIARQRHFTPMAVQSAMRALARDVNLSLHQCYVDVYGWHGTAGTTPFASSVADATQVRKVLNEQLCPLDMRAGVVDFAAEANMLALAQFSDAEKIGSNGVKLYGEIGMKYGIQWVADNHVVWHTAGVPGGTPAVNKATGYAAGATSIAVDGLTSSTGYYRRGDIITFAGHTQTYVVTNEADISATTGITGDKGVVANASGEIAELTISPPLKAPVADNAAITLKASHRVNLVFHPGAFAFATRPLVASTVDLELGSRIMSITDPVTNLSLRLEVVRQRKQVVWEFDILWGCKIVRPEFAARLAG